MHPPPSLPSRTGTSLTVAVDALARPSVPRARLTPGAALEASLRAASVFCATTLSMLGLWIVVPTMLLGWSASAIETGSMAPNLTRGDVVVLRPVDRRPPAVGDVVRFRLDGESQSTIHRIERIDRRNRTYVTRGDANDAADTTPVPFDRIEGSGAMLVPMLGYPVLWARSGDHLALALLGLGLVAVVGPGLRRRPRSDDEDDHGRRAPLRPLVAPDADPTPFDRRPLFPGRWVPGSLRPAP